MVATGFYGEKKRGWGGYWKGSGVGSLCPFSGAHTKAEPVNFDRPVCVWCQKVFDDMRAGVEPIVCARGPALVRIWAGACGEGTLACGSHKVICITYLSVYQRGGHGLLSLLLFGLPVYLLVHTAVASRYYCH